MAKKDLWLYRKSTRKRSRTFSYWTNHELHILKIDQIGQFDNFNCFRSPKGYHSYLRQKQICKEYWDEGYRIKQKFDGDFLSLRDSRSDIYNSAWYEKKCWKRNSRRKHQYK